MKSLKNVSDKELVSQLRTLVRKEQSLTLEILPFLAEVGSRGLYLAKGYGSLYEYCKNELGYTDASAWRRVRAALAIQRCPEAYAVLAQGRVTMCALGRVYKFITPAVLEKIRGKSQAEVEMIAAVFDAKGVVPDRTRAVMVPKAGPSRRPSRSVAGTMPGSGRLRSEVKKETGSSVNDHPLRSEVSEMTEQIEFEKKWKLEGVVSSRVKEKLDRCKSLLSNKYPNGVDYDALFDELTEFFLEKKDPEQGAKRRKKIQKPRTTNLKNPKTQTRRIPQAVKDKVWARDKGRCAFVGENGRRCNSTHNLQFDHYPVPFARGGPNTVSNLRLLCAKHNKFTAEWIYGKEHIEKFAAKLE